jgi:hypothetical protein
MTKRRGLDTGAESGGRYPRRQPKNPPEMTRISMYPTVSHRFFGLIRMGR